MLNSTLRQSFCYLKIIHILRSHYNPKIIGYILKNKQKNNCVCFDEVIRLNIMKMKMKMKKRSRRYDINRPRSRHRHKCSKYKKYLSMMILICVEEHLRNIWSSIHEKVKQHWGWVGKMRCLEKKRVIWRKIFSWNLQRTGIDCTYLRLLRN